MTPADAYEYVRSKRPRVLLAASQWQAVQDYEKRKNGSQTKLTSQRRLTFPVRLSLQDQSPMMPICISHRLYENNLTTNIRGRDICYDDSIVLVTSADLEGYRSIEDAGLIGNHLWKELKVTYRVRFVAARATRASAALARLSYLWVGCQTEGKAQPKDLPVASLKSLKSLESCSSIADRLPSMRVDVPICAQGVVNC